MGERLWVLAVGKLVLLVNLLVLLAFPLTFHLDHELESGNSLASIAGQPQRPLNNEMYSAFKSGNVVKGILCPSLTNSFKQSSLERSYLTYTHRQRQKSLIIVNVVDFVLKIVLAFVWIMRRKSEGPLDEDATVRWESLSFQFLILHLIEILTRAWPPPSLGRCAVESPTWPFAFSAIGAVSPTTTCTGPRSARGSFSTSRVSMGVRASHVVNHASPALVVKLA